MSADSACIHAPALPASSDTARLIQLPPPTLEQSMQCQVLLHLVRGNI